MDDSATFGAVFGLIWLFCVVAILVGVVASLLWVYRDAEAHGKSGILWLLIAFFTWPFGILAYYLLRDKEVKL